MRKKTLRMISSILTLVFLVSLFQAPMPVEAANTATIPVTVGGQTINVTPGQWVTVNTPGGSTSYNVRFVDGKPVALEMSQYTKLVFGDAASAAGTSNAGSNTTGSTGNNAASGAAGSNTGNAGTVDLGGSNSGSAAQTSTGAAQTSTPAPQTSTGAAQTSGTAAQTSGSAAQTSGTTTTTTTTTTGSKPMTWNEFQKANAGKGMSGSEMGQAWQQYKQTNGVTSNSGSAAAQTSGSAAQTSTGAAQTSTPTPTTSVAEGSAAAAQTTTTTTSTPAAQTSTGAAQASTPTTSVADGSAATSQTSSSSNWNPAKHPRDPQTGKFISHEEAVARGLMDPADANISSSGSSQTAQASTDSSAATQNAGAETAAASTETTATGGTAADTSSAQAAQAGTDVAAASGDKTSKPSIGDKFKSGYETGKNLTNQGFQNVKDSLKSGFSAKNLLVTAGITVGVDLATQVMRGENPSLKSALKTVCCAEFVGGVAGSVIGSAAGSFFVPFLSCIPVVGGALSALAPAFGSIVGSSVGAYTAGDLKNGRFSIKEAFKRIDWVGVTGQAIGSTVGAALGSCLGPVGTVLGGMVGGYFGNWAAQKIAGLFGKGSANLPVVAMPTGSNGNGVTVAGTVTLGGTDVTSVSVSNDIPVVVSDNDDEEKSEGMTGSDVEQAITEAYEEYTDYYTEYSKLIQAGKTQEAMEVAEKMNAAKAKYDELRKKG